MKINIDSVFQFRENSDDNVVLFFHGFNSTHKFINPLVKRNKTFNIHSLDFPGNGESELHHKIKIQDYADVAWEILNQYNKPITLVAHSLGGAIAIFIAKHPNVKKIILLAPVHPFMLEKGKAINDKSSIDFIVERTKSILKNKDKMNYLANATKSAVNYMYKFNQRSKYINEMMNEEILNKEFLNGTLLQKFNNNKKETIIIHGISDAFIPIESTRKLAKEMNWTLYELPNTAHSLISERPEQVLEIIENNIKK